MRIIIMYKNVYVQKWIYQPLVAVITITSNDEQGSYDCPKNFLPIKPLKGVKKKCVSRELNNEENEHRTKFVL